MNNLCIIPARGGSKRIPNKNSKDFLGLPIIAYSIQTAVNSGLFDEVMVSTDDEKIAAVALKYGAKIPFLRSDKNADDYATTVDVLKEVLNNYSKMNQSFDAVCCLYPTAPFVTEKKLTDALNLLIQKGFNSVFPVIPFSYPIQRALKIKENQKISLFQPKHLNTRSQDLEPAYHDAGQFYWFLPEVIEEKESLWTNNTGVIIIKESEGQDIDTPEDWKMAELKYKLLHE